MEPTMNVTRDTRRTAKGHVYSMGAEAGNKSSNLIQRDNEISSNTLTALFDSRANHSFIVMDCVNRLKLYASSLPFDLVVSISTKTLTVNIACLHCQPGVIKYLAANKLRVSLKEGTQEFLSSANMEGKINVSIEDVVLVKEYPDVFPTEISGLPSVREVEFFIDLHPGIGPISIVPYRMSPFELNELRGQIEDLL
ncbi:uncharacterized protein [Cicer arietinum]|uniref:Uncharacterized protein LOC101503628 n=1 Tax=Cicer arietinum TaxID=3827 RepID=A0A1S2Y780_CICAR|nr:uncharacterized protein LOC101503628 [Cicer arietinum]